MAGVHADLGEDAPDLEVRETMFIRGAFAADEAVRLSTQGVVASTLMRRGG